MTENRNGTVITLYSYMGGTGRTMTLANVAWILAANGHRVLTVDWDLEAPGLHKFFHPFLNPATLRATPGLSNLIGDYRREALRDLPDRAPDWHRRYARVRPHALTLDWSFPEGGSLDFLSAGRRHDDYPMIGNMDWELFYASYGGGRFFEAMRADMRRRYDYTLIDSRTGLSDLADVCTVQMPSTLVVCYTLSGQSIEAPPPSRRASGSGSATRASASCPSPCVSTSVRRTSSTRDAPWPGSASPVCRPDSTASGSPTTGRRWKSSTSRTTPMRRSWQPSATRRERPTPC